MEGPGCVCTAVGKIFRDMRFRGYPAHAVRKEEEVDYEVGICSICTSTP